MKVLMWIACAKGEKLKELTKEVRTKNFPQYNPSLKPMGNLISLLLLLINPFQCSLSQKNVKVMSLFIRKIINATNEIAYAILVVQAGFSISMSRDLIKTRSRIIGNIATNITTMRNRGEPPTPR